MAILDKGNILSFCKSKNTYLEGEKYYLNDFILELKETNNLEGTSNIKSLVDSGEYSEYLCAFKINKNKELEEFSCTCEEFLKKKKICPHLVSVYLKYINENLKSYSNIDKLLKVLNNSTEIVKTQSMNLEIELVHSSMDTIVNSIKLRIGLDKLYEIKDIRGFLESYNNNELFTLYRRSIVDFSTCDFRDEDKEIIYLLNELLEIEEKTAYYNNLSKGMFRKNQVYIPDKQFCKLLKLINKNITISLPIGTYFDVDVKTEDLVLDFLVVEKTDKIALTFKDRELPFPLLPEGKIYFYKGSIYELNKKDERLFNPLFDLMLENRKGDLEIDKADSTNFASFVLPKIKKIGRVYFEEGVKSLFYEENLITEIYLDKENDTIKLNLVFKYEDISFNPLNNNFKLEGNGGILVRDIKKEEDILELIKKLGFEKEENYFEVRDGDKIIDFLTEGVYKLQEIGEVYYSEQFKKTKVYKGNQCKYNLKLNREDMLEFSFNIDGIDQSELISIFESLRENKRYYKLKDGSLVLLNSRELREMVSLIDNLDIDERKLISDKVILPKFFASYINDIVGEEAETNKDFRELINNLKDIKHMEYSVPENLKANLREYQKLGFKWFKTLSCYGFGGILADEMGLGKTVQTIALIISDLKKEPSIIICPTSLVYNWNEEFEKFSSNIKVGIMDGSKKERQEIINNISKYDVVITSYSIIRRDIDEIKKLQFNYCVIDEAQNIKNPASQNSKSVKSIKSYNKFALTGTPIENSLGELWSIFDFIMPGYLLNHSKFLSLYETAIVKHENYEALKDLKRRINPFILRRLKRDVLEELPPKIEKNIIINMSEDQRKIYSAYVANFKNEISKQVNMCGLEKTKIKILSALTRLRQICCDPSSFLKDYTGESSKINALIEILQGSIEENHKILVFSQFTSVLKNIIRHLDLNNIEYFYLDGSVNSRDRMNIVNEFNKGTIPVFLISLKAGGSGLNLTSADIVIHFDQWWNPAVEEQATDRAHRIGQKNTVEVIKLITKGTIEEKILNIQGKKREIIGSVMDDEDIDRDILSSMTLEDIEGLFQL